MPSAKTPNYTPPSNIKVRGATSFDDDPYIRVTASGREAWMPRGAFTGSGSEALRILNAAGMPMLDKEWGNTKALVRDIERYGRKALLSRCGWDAGGDFALPGGDVIATSLPKSPVVLFPRDPRKCATSGTIEEWRAITALLADQPIAEFVLFAAYAAPFLSLTNYAFNPGFELAGQYGVGISTVQRVAAAACGPADDPSGLNYWMSANATMNAVDSVIAAHNDMPFIIDETSPYTITDSFAARARKSNALVVALAEGITKDLDSSGQPRRSRFVFTISTYEPLTADRLFTIPISVDRPFGIFDFLPTGYGKVGSLEEELMRGVRRCHGVAMRHMLERLVKERKKDPETLARRVRELMNLFRDQVQVGANEGAETRYADAAGLVYAAATLAVEWGAVSKELDPLSAALTCYQLNRASRAEPVSPAKMLLDLAEDFDILRVCAESLTDVSDAEVEDATGILRLKRNGIRELLLTENQFRRAVHDPARFWANREVGRMKIAENDRKGTKRKIRANRGPERFYCFRLPEDSG